jgi:hypothetical protein
MITRRRHALDRSGSSGFPFSVDGWAARDLPGGHQVSGRAHREVDVRKRTMVERETDPADADPFPYRNP